MTTTTAAQMLAVERSYLGYREGPNNSTIFGSWYGLPGQAWCDMFISYCAAKAGCAAEVGHFAYTPSHLAWFKSRNQFATTPKVGAIVFFNWGGRPPGVPEHVGIVEAVYSDGSIMTIEGNADNQVERVHRRTNIIGYGYPAYAAVGPPPVVNPTPHPKPPVYVPTISLANVQAAAKNDPAAAQGKTSHGADVLPVEKALVAMGYLDSHYADGSFGTLTVAAYSRWQHFCGYSGADANGIPGMTSLTRLGKRYTSLAFNVR